MWRYDLGGKSKQTFFGFIVTWNDFLVTLAFSPPFAQMTFFGGLGLGSVSATQLRLFSAST